MGLTIEQERQLASRGVYGSSLIWAKFGQIWTLTIGILLLK